MTDLDVDIENLVIRHFPNLHGKREFVPGTSFIPASGKMFDEQEVIALVTSAMNFDITEGATTRTFEREMSRFVGVRHASFCNSGSSANLLAFMALTSPKLGSKALKPGDEVITCAVGFPTTVAPIIQAGCVPVFVDVTIGNYNPTPHMIAEAITEKTRAIFIAHTLGNPFDVEAIKEIADQNNLFLIEDCADALGSKFHGKCVGTFGDISTTSFYPAHMMTTGEGGMVFTNNSMLNQIVRSLRDWGRECFPKGTLINSQESQIPIEDIKVGDIVLSHTGDNNYVTEVMSRNYTGNLYKIKPYNSMELSCTELHPFYVKRGNCFDWVYARDLKKSDLLVEALPQPNVGLNAPTSIGYVYKTSYKEEVVELPITLDLLRLVGYWMAEGSLASGKKGKSGYKENQYLFHRVDFSFNKNEVDYIEDVCSLMKEIFGVSGTLRLSKKGQGNGASLTFKSRRAFEFFGQFFGRGAGNKSLPQWALSLPLEYSNQLVIGYWRGDGSSSTAGYSFCSISPHLLNQIRRILGMNGVLSSYCLRTIDSHSSSVVDGKTIVAKHDAHWLNIYGESAKRLSEILGESEYKLGAKKNKSFTDYRYVYYPIDSIQVSKVRNLRVYNLEVGIDHSYHANNIAVHNCWCLPGKDNTCGKRFSHKDKGSLPDGYDHKYVYSHVGYNLKGTDIQASLGLEQLKKLPNFIEQRKRNWGYLFDGFVDSGLDKYFILPHHYQLSDPSPFGFLLTIKSEMDFTKGELVQYLEKMGIGTRNLFAGNVTKQPGFEGLGRLATPVPKADIVMNNTFWIGCHPSITIPMLDYVIETFTGFVENHD